MMVGACMLRRKNSTAGRVANPLASVQIATQTADLSSELKRGLSFVRKKSLARTPKKDERIGTWNRHSHSAVPLMA
jgi:hypothetical protein